VKKTRDFARFVRGGATELNLDTSNRLVLPKRLLEYANISGPMIMLGNGPLIEMWDLATYDTLLDISPDDFSDLAEDVMLAFAKDEADRTPNFDGTVVVPIIQSRMR
jgi:MraZ protein